MSFLLHWTGGDNPTGPIYSEYSGFLGIVVSPLITALTTLFVLWVHSRCHVKGCLKRGKFPFRHYRLCARHHPRVPARDGVTHLHIIQLHKGKKQDGKHTGTPERA